jgi:squalene-hopene/tetraprenyl-beta-curcumene cyclase
VLPLPFELAALPHHWFAAVRLPVVSYALPALIAIGQARHVHRPSRNPFARLLRTATRGRTLRVLQSTQPPNGGFLEATPLTSFVTMSLAGSGQADHPVAVKGEEFLLRSQRADGSWPIDTNLSTWVTTLALGALGGEGVSPGVLARWLLAQQHRVEHPFTHAAPGGWAWTPLPGGVPDADDTSGALLALCSLRARAEGDAELCSLAPHIEEAWAAGARWLMGLQNRDGGVPTFCRGWGALPFDQSSPDITAHALRAWRVSPSREHARLEADLAGARRAAELFLVRSQETEGSWVPLWFGNQQAPGEVNRVYGTSRVILGLLGAGLPEVEAARRRGVDWLCAAQAADGSWGGAEGGGSVEETGLALEALGGVAMASDGRTARLRDALERGVAWLVAAEEAGRWSKASPIGLYFARLWYAERLYPMVFGLAGLRAAAGALAGRWASRPGQIDY